MKTKKFSSKISLPLSKPWKFPPPKLIPNKSKGGEKFCVIKSKN